MKYTIHGFSQQKAIELGLGSDELLILRWFIDFKNTGKMKKMIYKDHEWTWINYDGLLEDLPIIGGSKKTVQRKLNKLIDCGIMDRYVYKKGGSYSYFRIIEENFGQLIFSAEDKLVQKKSAEDNISQKIDPENNFVRPEDTFIPKKEDQRIKTTSYSGENYPLIADKSDRTNNYTTSTIKLYKSTTSLGKNSSLNENLEIVRKKIIEQINNFFIELTPYEKEIIEEIDNSFYELKSYVPSDNELIEFLKNNTEDIFNYFTLYLHTLFETEGVIYQGGLLFPRISLFNKVKFRCNQLLSIYYKHKEENKITVNSPCYNINPQNFIIKEKNYTCSSKNMEDEVTKEELDNFIDEIGEEFYEVVNK